MKTHLKHPVILPNEAAETTLQITLQTLKLTLPTRPPAGANKLPQKHDKHDLLIPWELGEGIEVENTETRP